jgi:hypothetical protein
MPIIKERLHYIDSLRASTMLAVLTAHVLVSFTTGLFAWPTQNITTSKIFNAVVVSLHAFTMPLFFFVAGFVAYQLHSKLGSLGFIRQRLKRIGLPFLLGMLFLFYYHTVAWLNYIMLQCQNKQINDCFGAGGIVAVQAFFSKNWLMNLRAFYDGVGSLWFLYYLLLLYAVVVVFIAAHRAFFVKLPQWDRVSNLFSHYFQSFITFRWHVVILIILTALNLLPLPGWYIISPTSFIPNGWLLIFYGWFFFYGWRASHTPILIAQWQTRPWIWLWILLLLPTYALLVNYQSWLQHYYLIKFIALLACTACGWLMVFAATSFYFRYLNQSNRVLRYLADASYWIYLISIPMVIYWQYYFSQSNLNVLLQIIIIFSAVLSIALLSYQVLVRHTFIGRRLLGTHQR